MSKCKKAWKYLKGSERDFAGAHAGATHKYVHKELGHPIYTANPEIIKEVLFNLVAVREPITECTFQDGVVFDAPIGMPLNEFKCRQQSLNANDSDMRLNGIPVGEFSAKADVEVVKYDPTKLDIESLVTERGNRYGKFADGAKIMRSLKAVMHNTDGWSRLTDSQREALDMIQHKIGRILNGDPAYDDNWKDIAGYSKLIADELNGEIK
jgi:hypothetical protein|nr:MAG TPA: hypothetical protein [Caudoviricetes sp.]